MSAIVRGMPSVPASIDPRPQKPPPKPPFGPEPALVVGPVYGDVHCDSIGRIQGTVSNQNVSRFAMELLGPYSQFEYRAAGAIDHGKWSHRMLAARRGTIAAGTNEIQHNIIGERVLGLPKG